MSQNLPEENLIRNYLLGHLPDDEQNVLEERLLTNPEFFETSLMIEGELLDDYVMGLLSESDRRRLESGLLMSTQQRRRVQLIRLLYLKSNATKSADERLTSHPSRLNRYFSSVRSNLAWRFSAV